MSGTMPSESISSSTDETDANKGESGLSEKENGRSVTTDKNVDAAPNSFVAIHAAPLLSHADIEKMRNENLNPFEHAYYRIGMGLDLANRGDWEGALRNYRKALCLIQTLHPQSLDEANCHAHIAWAMDNIGFNLNTLYHLQQALTISQCLAPWSMNTAIFTVNVGEFAARQGHLDDALRFYNQALVILDSWGVENSVAVDVRHRIGCIMQRKQELTDDRQQTAQQQEA